MSGIFVILIVVGTMAVYFHTMKLFYKIIHGTKQKPETSLISDILVGSALVGITMYCIFAAM